MKFIANANILLNLENIFHLTQGINKRVNGDVGGGGGARVRSGNSLTEEADRVMATRGIHKIWKWRALPYQPRINRLRIYTPFLSKSYNLIKKALARFIYTKIYRLLVLLQKIDEQTCTKRKQTRTKRKQTRTKCKQTRTKRKQTHTKRKQTRLGTHTCTHKHVYRLLVLWFGTHTCTHKHVYRLLVLWLGTHTCTHKHVYRLLVLWLGTHTCTHKHVYKLLVLWLGTHTCTHKHVCRLLVLWLGTHTCTHKHTHTQNWTWCTVMQIIIVHSKIHLTQESISSIRCVHVFLCVHVHGCEQMCMCMMCILAFMCLFAYTCACRCTCAHACVCVCVCVCGCVCVCVCVCVCARTWYKVVERVIIR